MEKILEFGGAPKCSDDQKKAFLQHATNLYTLLMTTPPDLDAIKKALKDMGTVTIDLEGVKAPGFFQRVATKCVTPLKDIMIPPTPAPPPPPAYGGLRSKALMSWPPDKIPDALMKQLAQEDIISVSQGEIKPDWIRIGLSAGVLFLLVVVLLLLMRKPQTEYLR